MFYIYVTPIISIPKIYHTSWGAYKHPFVYELLVMFT
jgi:hypothetical protein